MLDRQAATAMSPEAGFAAVVEACRQAHLDVVALRPASALRTAMRHEGDDIDLFVPAHQWRACCEVLRSAGFFNLFGRQYFKSPTCTLTLDVHHGGYLRVPFLTEHELRGAQVNEMGVLALSDVAQLAILTLHPLDLTGFRGRRPHTEEKKAYIRAALRNPMVSGAFNAWLTRCGGRAFQEAIGTMMVDGFKHTAWSVTRMKLALFAARPGYLRHVMARAGMKVAGQSAAAGRVIAVVGVDGSGKTTLATDLMAFMSASLRDKKRVQYSYMGRQGGHRLPLEAISAIKRACQRALSSRRPAASSATSGATSPKPETSTFERPIWRYVLLLEYLVRAIELQIQVRLLRRIVMTDRYLYDLTLNRSLSRIFQPLVKLFPTPSHVLFLQGDTSIFYDRKKEYSTEELSDMQSQLLSAATEAHGDKLHVLAADRSAEDVLRQALAALGEE